MAYVQLGFLGGVGPLFTDDSPGGGKKILLQGQVIGGSMKLVAKQPAYAGNISGLVVSDYVLGSYADNQTVGDAPAYTQPATGPTFFGYLAKVSDWVTATSVAGLTTTTNSTSTGTTSSVTSTSTGTTSTGSTDTTFSAPTIMEQITTFLSNYWWLVLLIVGFLLWKPVIAPALGMGKKRRR